jgi:hypothetical protein
MGPRAAALWNELHEPTATVVRSVLIGEACRLIDRLDKLDRILAGEIDTWAKLILRTQSDAYELKIDGAANEARQTATALRQILAQLTADQSESPGGSIADEIAARRAARQPNPAG